MAVRSNPSGAVAREAPACASPAAPLAPAALPQLRDGGSFGALLDAVPDAVVVVDPTGRMVLVNAQAEALFGYPRAMLIGQPVEMLLPQRIGTVHAAHRAHFAAASRKRPMGSGLDLVARRADGTEVGVDVSLSPVDLDGAPCVIASVRDLTEQRLAQSTMAESAVRIDESEAIAHLGSWLWDLATGAVQWSAELYRIHAVSPAQFAGTLAAHLDFIRPEDRERVERALLRTLATGEPCEDEYRLTRGAESRALVRWVYTRAVVVRDGTGRKIGLRGVCQDVTERQQAREAMRDAYERERAAVEELLATDRLKDEFLTTLSHELRTPLTSIIGFAALLDREDLRAQPEWVDAIVRNAAEMHGMIERLLDFSRLQAGEIHVAPVAIDLSSAVKRILAQFGSAARNHSIVIDIAADLRVLADIDGLTRVVSNLVLNAVNFSPAGSCIEVRASRAGDGTAVIAVKDEGPGVRPELQKTIFERFVRGSDPPRGKRGTGVGLAVVQRYVELQHGRVWCDSTIGHGATFLFTLPLAP